MQQYSAAQYIAPGNVLMNGTSGVLGNNGGRASTNTSVTSIPPIPSGFTPTQPLSNAIRTINQALPTAGGQTSISPQVARQTHYGGNEEDVSYYLVSKNWGMDPDGYVPVFGDKTAYLGHEYQLKDGDCVFISSSTKNTPASEKRDYEVVSAELAKLNEILAAGYLSAKKDFNNPGLGISDGHMIRSESTSSYANTIHHREVIQVIWDLIYNNGNNEEPVKVNKITVNQLLKLYNEMYGENFLEEVEGAEDYFMQDVYVDQKQQQNYGTTKGSNSGGRNYPPNQTIYKRFYQKYPEKNRYGNSLGMFDTTKKFDESVEAQNNAEYSEILEILKFFSDEDSFVKTDELHMMNMKILLHWAIIEILASSEKYIKYCTLSGVINHWHFYGVVRNTGEGKAPSNFNKPPSGNATRVNYSVERKARVTNRWGTDLPPNTKLFFIIKKLTANGPYQVIPWYDKSRGTNNCAGRPSYQDLEYFDEDGVTKCMGFSIYVGTTTDRFTDNFNDESRKIANGIVSSISNIPIPFNRALDEKRNISAIGSVLVCLQN